MNLIRSLLICSLLFSLNAVAQEQDSITLGDIPQESRPTLLGRLQQVQQYLDSTARAKVDPHYIEVPEKPWRAIVRYKKNAVDVQYDNSIDYSETEHADWQMHFAPPVASSVGFWLGYRGTGISYSKSLHKNAGRYFSFGSTGAKYGINFRLRRFRTDETTITASEYENGQFVDKQSHDAMTFSPIWIRSVSVNGYYVFNGRRYSQAAAYNQSVIQRRSAGSFLLGATWYQSSLDYSDKQNAGLMLLSHNIGRIKLQQASIGIGYGYNLVPFRGLVINLMVMPSLSIYNSVKVDKYDFNYDLSDAPADDYGEWNPQTRTWANGKSHKPILSDDVENTWLQDIDSWHTGSETEHSNMRFSVDLRLGIAYNWKNYFIALQSQFNYFSYKKEHSEVRLIDGFAQASLGVRF